MIFHPFSFCLSELLEYDYTMDFRSGCIVGIDEMDYIYARIYDVWMNGYSAL